MNTLKTYIQEADAVERNGRIKRTLIMARVTLVGSDRISDSLTSSLPHFYPSFSSFSAQVHLFLHLFHLHHPHSLSLLPSRNQHLPPLKLSLQNSSHFFLFKNMNFCFDFVCFVNSRFAVGCCRFGADSNTGGRHLRVAPPPSGPLSPYAGPVFVF